MKHAGSLPSHYDYIFAGGGLAGLSLAWEIAHSPLRDRSMLIVDRDTKQRDDRTFSFWSDKPGPFDQVISCAWDRLSFHAQGFSHTAGLGRYRYQTIRGVDFYRQVHQALAACPQVTFLNGHISQLREDPGGVVISVNGQDYTGRWAFDSRFRPSEIISRVEAYHYLEMVFRGWDIETEREVFNPQVATLMDFRTPATSDVRFFYVLPWDERHALVEYTLFTQETTDRSASDAALHDYLQTSFHLTAGRDCQVRPREAGSLLITDQPFPRRLGRRTLAIGLRGGRLKPSTGYAFTRIQRDSQAILRSLLRSGDPFDLPGDPSPYPQMDSILLEIMHRHPQRIPGIFTALFQNNTLERVLRFLDEDTSLGEISQLIATLPPGLFLKVLARRSVTPHTFLRSLQASS